MSQVRYTADIVRHTDSETHPKRERLTDKKRERGERQIDGDRDVGSIVL